MSKNSDRLKKAWVTRKKTGSGVIPHNKINVPSKKELEHLYFVEKKSMSEIRKHYSLNSNSAVRSWFTKYEIPRRSISERVKVEWKQSSYIRSQMKARNRTTQNKAEKKLEDLLNITSPGKYKFVGDGSVIIGGRCPDFIDEEQKKIIEMFGNYWHQSVDEKLKIEHFESHGYKTLVVWEKELKDEESLKEKLIAYDII